MLAPLVNRAAELRRLNAAWQRATEGIPQLLVVWGRRRVGKTFLLSHFAEGKRAVFFGATQQAEAIELRRLTEVSGRDLGDQAAHLAGGGLPTWEAALQFFSAVAQEHIWPVVGSLPGRRRCSSSPPWPRNTRSS